MQSSFDAIFKLTTQPLENINRKRLLNDFAFQLGWHPSDSFETPDLETAHDHLLVEHGLQNSAVISFIRYPRSYLSLSYSERNSLLKISYNNLVDWHIQIEKDNVTVIYNRTDPPAVVDKFIISNDTFERLRSDSFEEITGKRPSPNFPGLDDALIDTISFWKRNLSASLDYSVSNESLSALFNIIMFSRAVEDHRRRLGTSQSSYSSLLSIVSNSSDTNYVEMFTNNFMSLGINNIPEYLLDSSKLKIFQALDRYTFVSLISDFYRIKFTPYEYDFSVMSKHALSRIYEHYVSILRLEDSPQLSFFPRLPEEERAKSLGGIYTPQFVARFFAKYLRDELPPAVFRNIKVIDPACGSGIFLRTLLEIKCDPSRDDFTTEQIGTSFRNISGLDVDPNATQATRLSLALLHLVLTGEIPVSLDVVTSEALTHFNVLPRLNESFDAVIANPPYVSLDKQPSHIRDTIREMLGVLAIGRVDTYLAFLWLCIKLLKPGGYGLFVLPHSFLINKSSKKIRAFLYEHCLLRCIADLSAIKVFNETGVYVILLIFQKKNPSFEVTPPVKVVKCQDFVGRALQETLEGKFIESNMYSIYEVPQDTFNADEWLLLPPTEAGIKLKMSRLPRLDDFLDIKEGFVSGADDVFIVDKLSIPRHEKEIYVPYLADREMISYRIPEIVGKYVFYPFVGDKKLDEDALITNYPKTWQYLGRHKSKLEKRGSLRTENKKWWEPIRPRQRKNILSPKIVTPHLVLVPRFALDATGEYAVSHSPFMIPREKSAGIDVLKFFLGVLNSSVCFWYLSNHSHTYQHGYLLLEPKTLVNTPVPDPSKLPPNKVKLLIDLVDQRLICKSVDSKRLENEIDLVVAEMYGISETEKTSLGIV
jgi:methylase of polypeptide subunit release factors